MPVRKKIAVRSHKVRAHRRTVSKPPIVAIEEIADVPMNTDGIRFALFEAINNMRRGTADLRYVAQLNKASMAAIKSRQLDIQQETFRQQMMSKPGPKVIDGYSIPSADLTPSATRSIQKIN